MIDEEQRLADQAAQADASAGRDVHEVDVPILEDGPRGWTLAAPWRWVRRWWRAK